MAETPISITQRDGSDWHSKDTVVTPETIVHSKLLYAAGQAMLKGTATPEQRELVADADRMLQGVLARARSN